MIDEKEKAVNDEPQVFVVDQFHLDKDWVQQPEFYHQYATKLADARMEWELAKADRDVVFAELDKAIRLTPSEYGLEKLTETIVANTVLLQPEAKKANRKVIEKRHEADLLQAMVDALDHRKKALENLVMLQGRDYFSEPRVDDEDVREVLNEKRKKHVRKKGQVE